MAAQQIQVKLFAYSVVERKDEIEEVSRPLLRQRPSTTTALAPYPHALPYNAVSCVCVYDPHVVVVDSYASCARAVCVDRPSRSRRRRHRVFCHFVLSLRNTNGAIKRSRASRPGSTTASTTMPSPATSVRTRAKRKSSAWGCSPPCSWIPKTPTRYCRSTTCTEQSPCTIITILTCTPHNSRLISFYMA